MEQWRKCGLITQSFMYSLLNEGVWSLYKISMLWTQLDCIRIVVNQLLLPFSSVKLWSCQVSILNQFSVSTLKWLLVPIMDYEQVTCVLGKLLHIFTLINISLTNSYLLSYLINQEINCYDIHSTSQIELLLVILFHLNVMCPVPLLNVTSWNRGISF